jgi:SAM-dependent methyltransferase
MTELTDHTRTYWQYEYDVSARSMVPLLRGWGRALEGTTVLDVGCAEGGGLCALHDAGALCAGFDLDAPRVDAARLLAGGRAIEFAIGDMYRDPLPFAGRTFDLVTLHDVFEHLDHKLPMLRRLASCLRPDGAILITFPPYYSAYGAHQQHLRTSYARIPFFHLLPLSLSFLLPRMKNEAPHIVEEVSKLGRLKMGMRKFERLAAEAGLQIAHKQAYLISPNHIRFGLTPIPAGPVSGLPVIGELFCSGVVYLLGKGS